MSALLRQDIIAFLTSFGKAIQPANPADKP